MFSSILTVGAGIAVLAYTSLAQNVDWNSIQPSTTLNFTHCYNGARKCARLTVPLDWLNPDLDSSVEVHLAVIALPAVVSEDDPSFGGTIITNPGGPGGSGTTSVGGPNAEAMQSTADIDGEKHYEILSFDPRGVGESTPNADCLEDLFARYMFQREILGIGNWSATDETLARYVAKQEQFVRRCKLTGDKYEHDIRNYMSTTTAARDMLHIVDKLDELRNGTRKQGDGSRDLPRIQYWGFSYGTALGNYFASMFPGRVERMLLEGVVDVEDWVAGIDRSIVDSPKAYDYIWQACFDNKSRCAMYRPGDTSANTIQLRFDEWLEKLDKDPEVYVDGVIDQVITSWNIRQYIFSPLLYLPREMVEFAMQIFDDMMNGDFTTMAHLLTPPGSGTTCPLIDNSWTRPWNSDAASAVICGDRVDQTNFTAADFKQIIEDLRDLSPNFGDLFARNSAPCLAWPYRPEYRFTGPFGTPEPDPNRVEGKPAAPILFASSEIDPVTPLSAAQKMSKLHPGSGVLVMEGSGHTTLNAPSACRKKYISQYWATGEMPPKDLVCEVECEPFQECEQVGSVEDVEDLVRLTSFGLY